MPSAERTEFQELYRELLKSACKLQGITQEEFAEARLGRTRQTVNAVTRIPNACSFEFLLAFVEAAELKEPTAQRIKRLWLMDRLGFGKNGHSFRVMLPHLRKHMNARQVDAMLDDILADYRPGTPLKSDGAPAHKGKK